MGVMEEQREQLNNDIARRWCESKGHGWSLRDQAGRGGTAPVYTVESPDGPRALKLYDAEFSAGDKGKIEAIRVRQQVDLGLHTCPSLIKVYEGGQFEDRLFLLMNRAPGRELEKRLHDVPREKIRSIIDKVASACIFLRQKGICHRDIKSANIFVSDDFNDVTLLDLSVTRDIYDPVGIGTDHDGQLPVVATARYSPPEYLFRLLEPGAELWHALDVYQLGGVLHDLIMREPLFQTEYLRSKENRYRFAWIVATTEPLITATDVDQDLVFTARRALEKNWEKRSSLRLEDFLADEETQRVRALDALGLSKKVQLVHHGSDKGTLLSRVNEVAVGLKARIQEFLRREGVTAHHYLERGDGDLSKRMRFEWAAPNEAAISGDIKFEIELTLSEGATALVFEARASLSATITEVTRTESLALPVVEDSTGSNDRLGEHAEASIGVLASRLMRSDGSR